ncbi:MAG TPA: YerC/YecD family TrpR-related protein [Candidatus Limnocylindrales bacterium]|nr:YerC/YecD family TrpR-related protein [Candidatus Limnocylindrales bacterium]
MATKMTEDWRTADTDELIAAVLRLEAPDEAARFLRDLCTLGELRDLAQRWAVARRLDGGEHYAAISRETGASTATITRIASWLNHGEGGYREALDRLAAARKTGIPYPAGQES